MDSGVDGDLSISNLVESNSDELKRTYLSWVYEIGEFKIKDKKVIDYLTIRPGLSYWWAASIAQKFNYSPSSHVNDSIKVLALERFLQKHQFNTIVLASNNKSLSHAISAYCQSKRIIYQFQTSGIKDSYGDLLNLIPEIAKASFFLLRFIYNSLQQYFWRPKTKALVGNLLFIDVLAHLDKKTVIGSAFNSNYWTVLVGKLEELKLKSNWLHLFFPHKDVTSLKNASNFIDGFNNSNDSQFHELLDRPLTIKMYIRVIRDFFRLRKCFQNLKGMDEFKYSNSSMDLWPLHYKEWKKSLCGSLALEFLIRMEQFLAAFQSLPKQRLGIYIAENQSWEFALIYAWRAVGHGRLMG